MIKRLFNWLGFGAKKSEKIEDVFVEAGKVSLRKYGEVYQRLEKYDKGELPETEKMVKSRNFKDFIQSV